MDEKTEMKGEYLPAKKVTKRKKITVLMVALAVFILLRGIHSFFGNYRFGWELYTVTCEMALESRRLTYGIDYLENKYANLENDEDIVQSYLFDRGTVSMGLHWPGYDDLPFLEDVNSKWIKRLWKLYCENDSDENVKDLFINPKKAEEMALLKEQLIFLTDSLIEFRDRYAQMPVWKRYFVSWENERDRLSEKVDILQSEEE